MPCGEGGGWNLSHQSPAEVAGLVAELAAALTPSAPASLESMKLPA